MTTQPFDGYYVFEADQVLTNDHLNQEFYYLDQQGRQTRNKLIGTGIVCGLDITSAANKITISKGSGVTSEGYLILPDSPVTYDSFVQYKGVTQPADLPFTPDLPSGYILPFFDAYCAGTTVYQLLDSTKYTTQNPMPVGSDVLSNIALSGYAVVLFLEINEKDLKNCDTQDCNNKGEKMMIAVQALLVPVTALPAPADTSQGTEIRLKRYNVPYAVLNNAGDVLAAFETILKNGVLNQVGDAYDYSFNHFKAFLTDTQNPFSSSSSSFGGRLKAVLTTLITTTNLITIQYLYDYINDLILAYHEFRDTAYKVLPAQCCGDELAFPLHLVLGAANSNTNALSKDAYRNYFIYSPIFDKHSADGAKLQFLFNRMKVLAAAFDVKLYTGINDIKITPSQYMDFSLSARCIPFYYDTSPVNDITIYQSWNYRRTITGGARANLSYNAAGYSQDESVVSPLLYDIEKYNFFRIEGHIGQKYANVLSHLLNERLTYNLPFDVVAISAGLLSLGSANVPSCNVVDMESAYNLLVTEFLSKLFLCFYKFISLPYKETALADGEGTFKVSVAGMADLDDNAFLQSFTPKFSTYQYGDYISKYAPAAQTDVTASEQAGAGTSPAPAVPIGEAYVAYVKAGAIQNDTFNNPMAPNNSDLKIANLHYLRGYNSQFSLLYTIDELFYLLLNTKLANMTIAKFTLAYERFNKNLQSFGELINKEENHAVFNGCGCDCLVSIVKEILVLLKEYQKRVEQYLAELSFLNYYKKHPGLEHKAGVPKGGTFVLVYYEATLTPDVDIANVERMLPATVDVKADEAATGDYTIDEKTLMMMREFVDQCGDAPANTKQQLLNNLPPTRKAPRPRFPLIDNGAVIADFYVPYLCCSDCAPVAYMIDNKLSVYTLSGGGSACAGNTNDNAGISSVQLSGSDIDVNYNLYNSGEPAFKVTMTGTGNLLDFGVQTAAGTYTVTAVSADGNTKTNMNGSAVVTLNQPPAAFNLKTTGPAGYCIGSDGVDIFLDGSQSGVSYQLYNDGTADPAVPVNGSGSAIDFGNRTSGSYTVIATNADTGCTNTMNNTVVVTASVPPVAQTVTGGGSYCANKPNDLTIGLKDSESGVTYQLFNTVDGNMGPALATVASTGGEFNFVPQSAAGSYSVEAINAAGCTTQMLNTVDITTVPVPSSQIQTPPMTATDEDGRELVITLTAVETDLSYTFKWALNKTVFTQNGLTPKQTAKNVMVVKILIDKIRAILDKTKNKGVSLTVSLTVTNGGCVSPDPGIDLWPTLAQYATANS